MTTVQKCRFFISILLLTLAVTEIHAQKKSLSYHDDIGQISDTTIISQNDTISRLKAIEIRAKLPDYKEGDDKNIASFGIVWGDNSGNKYEVTLTPGNTAYGHTMDCQCVTITVSHSNSTDSCIIFSKTITKDIGLGNTENSLSVEFGHNKQISIYTGNKGLTKVAEINLPTLKRCTYTGIKSIGKSIFKLWVVETEYDNSQQLNTKWNIATLSDRFRNQELSPHEGFWEYLDRDNDERYGRLGGNYRLALVASDDNGYDIIYISGASIEKSKWKEGMKKGHLEPTIFQNHYNLTWYDTSMSEITKECSATIEQDAILSLNFPLLHTQIRFSKEIQRNK